MYSSLSEPPAAVTRTAFMVEGSEDILVVVVKGLRAGTGALAKCELRSVSRVAVLVTWDRVVGSRERTMGSDMRRSWEQRRDASTISLTIGLFVATLRLPRHA